MSDPFKSEKRLADKLDKLGDRAENWNYHDEAEMWRALAADIRDGAFSRGCQVGSGAEFRYLDGEDIINWLRDHAKGRY